MSSQAVFGFAFVGFFPRAAVDEFARLEGCNGVSHQPGGGGLACFLGCAAGLLGVEGVGDVLGVARLVTQDVAQDVVQHGAEGLAWGGGGVH